jgi:hypothetical protein
MDIDTNQRLSRRLSGRKDKKQRVKRNANRKRNVL